MKASGVSSLDLGTVWDRLGGREIKHRRARAFWRGGDGLNVDVNLEKGVWHDHVNHCGGGALQLVEVALDTDRKGALKWLESEGLLEPLKTTPAERRAYAKAKADAAITARLALAWITEYIFELELAKSAAVDLASDRIDEDALAAAAGKEHRLRSLDASGVILAWQAARLADPAETMRLERGGAAWRATCESLAWAVVDSMTKGGPDVVA